MKLTPLKLKGTSPKKDKAPPLVRLDDKDWSSPGVQDAKPAFCRHNCPYASVSGGFVRDYIPYDPKLLVLFPTPQKYDVIRRDPLGSDYKKWFLHKIVKNSGLEAKDVAIAHMLRCYCGGKYPTGRFVRTAENVCRHYDYEHGHNGKAGMGGIANVFDPNLFYLTLDPRTTMGNQAFYRLFRMDFNRCSQFANMEYKPALLCGAEVASMIAPFKLAGGIKSWRGHWWEGSWPFKRGQGAAHNSGGFSR
jgi:hypothetical protein